MTDNSLITPALDDADTFAKGDWVEYFLGDDHSEARGTCRWLGPTGQGPDGRFVKKGSPDERYLLSCGLTYRRIDVDRGLVRIRRAPIMSTERALKLALFLFERWHEWQGGPDRPIDARRAVEAALAEGLANSEEEVVNAMRLGLSYARKVLQ